MRIPVLVAWAVVVAFAVPAGMQVQTLVIVIDGDTAVADAREATRLRATLAERLDPDASASYFELSSERLEPVPAAQAASFRRTTFTVAPVRYSGVSVSFGESVEVLRGNEAMRDTLIARECQPSATSCGGLVQAAATAEVRRVEETSARKLRLLATRAASWRGARVVLLTAGWPARDDGRVGLRRNLREWRSLGVPLTVVRLAPLVPFRGLVRDASESLAAQLPAGFLLLENDEDVEQVARALGGAAASSSASGASEPVAGEPAIGDLAPATADAAPAADRAVDPVGQPITVGLDATLRRAASYVARFERTFTAVLWHERYEQEHRVWRRFGSSGAVTAVVAGRRTIESDLFFAWLPQDGTWISVRDVITVDGRQRPAGERRLARLGETGSVSLLELRELARENGRYNIGAIVRTFNEPTLALLFLDDRNRARVSFARGARRRVDDRDIVRYTFREVGRPTLIQNDSRDVPVQGSVDVDDATGAITHSTIEMSDAQARLTGRMDVAYEPHVGFDVLVPHEMRETYEAAGRERVTAVAIYSAYRRFQSTGRLILTR